MEDRIYLRMPYYDAYGYLRFPVQLDGKTVSLQNSSAAAYRYAEKLAEELGCTFDVETP